ncbi:MAG: hypothetical protein WC344_04355 [Bacilli bacterium]|jgi:hypothetical protein
MKRNLLLWPAFCLFLVGCNGQNDSFLNDEYKPKGMAPTHKIVKALTDDEIAIFDASVVAADVYVTTANESYEHRDFEKKILASHATSATCDIRYSDTNVFKRYDNDIAVESFSFLYERVYTGTMVRSTYDDKSYSQASSTEITLTLDMTDESLKRTVTSNTNPYNSETDYGEYFVTDLNPEVWSKIGDGIIGFADGGLIANIDVNTEVTPVNNGYLADDGSRFIVERNSIFEAYFTKAVDAETETAFYYPSYVRAYGESLILSEVVPNVATEPITYLKKPVLLNYEEFILTTSLASNGNFVSSDIPEPTEV